MDTVVAVPPSSRRAEPVLAMDASRSAPFGDPFVLVRMALMSVLVAILAFTWADPDLWGHVLFGRDIVSDGVLARVDPYSFTSDKAWVNHEWLSEVAMYGAYAAGGMLGLMGLKVTVVVLAMLLLWRAIHRVALPAIARDILLFLAIAGANNRLTTVRPQLFSVLLFAVLLTFLLGIDQGRRRWIVGLPLIMVPWVNLHGGWLVGLGTIGLWATFRFVYPLAWLGRMRLAAVMAAVVLATLANPYGVGLWTFLAETVRLGRPNISEWQPIVAFPATAVPWALAWIIGAVAVYRSRQAVPWAYVAIAAALGLASFRVSRLDAFFVFAVVMLLAPQVGRLWSTTSRLARRGPAPSRRAVIAVSSVAWLVIAGAGLTTILNLSSIRVLDDEAPEPEVAAFILENGLSGRMLTWFDWGEYAIWHFAPDIKVSFDGRRETIYTDRFIQQHMAFYFDAPGAREFARNLEPDYIWLPKELLVVPTLLDDGWHPLYEGSVSIVLSDQPRENLADPVTPVRWRRSFPGP